MPGPHPLRVARQTPKSLPSFCARTSKVAGNIYLTRRERIKFNCWDHFLVPPSLAEDRSNANVPHELEDQALFWRSWIT
jgi:hypothetical protein